MILIEQTSVIYDLRFAKQTLGLLICTLIIPINTFYLAILTNKMVAKQIFNSKLMAMSVRVSVIMEFEANVGYLNVIRM